MKEEDRKKSAKGPFSTDSEGKGFGTTFGGGIGAVAGGAIGSIAGPAGTVPGAVAGAAVGAAIGHAVGAGEVPDENYWKDHYQRQSFYRKEFGYGDYAPAFRLGYQHPASLGGESFQDSEPALREEWERTKGSSRLEWEDARHATRAAWERAESGRGRRRP